MNQQRNDRLIEAVEEHLLVCEQCRCRLEEVEQETRVLRIALRGLQTSPLVH